MLQGALPVRLFLEGRLSEVLGYGSGVLCVEKPSGVETEEAIRRVQMELGPVGSSVLRCRKKIYSLPSLIRLAASLERGSRARRGPAYPHILLRSLKKNIYIRAIV